LSGGQANVRRAAKSAERFLPVEPCGEGLIMIAHDVPLLFVPAVGMPIHIVVSPASDPELRFYQ